MSGKVRALFLCTGNSCRSQMAEGLCHALHGDRLEAFSAGIEKHGLNPLAVKVMAEIGIDISAQQSKTLDELPGLAFDWVITVCDHAQASCPVFPGAVRIIHQSFADPPALAAGASSESEALVHYRRVRDEIARYVAGLADQLGD